MKIFCKFSIFTIFFCFAQFSYAQYKMPENLPGCKDWKVIAKELPELPTTDYPAKNYDRAKLLERLVTLANNPVTPKELQYEFGLNFFECVRTYTVQKISVSQHMYFSKGQLPLGGEVPNGGEPIDAVYIKFGGGTVSISLNINQIAIKNKNESPDCVYRNQVIEALGKDWILSEITHPYGAWHDKKVNELRQRLFMTFEYVELPYCKNKGGLDRFSITYNIKD